MANYFGTIPISQEKELTLRSRYDLSMDPREWMGRNGHRIICGDSRRYQFQDKELEQWIHTAYKALTEEGIELLWKEFLTHEEITEARDIYENP